MFLPSFLLLCRRLSLHTMSPPHITASLFAAPVSENLKIAINCVLKS